MPSAENQDSIEGAAAAAESKPAHCLWGQIFRPKPIIVTICVIAFVVWFYWQFGNQIAQQFGSPQTVGGLFSQDSPATARRVFSFDESNLTIPRNELRRGAPPNGIPAISNPKGS